MYFYRICDWNEEIEAFLRRYYEEARLTGVIIEGRLPNPDSRQLAYYEEMMGMEFQMNMGFLLDRLQKWLPRMNGRQPGAGGRFHLRCTCRTAEGRQE